MASNKRDRQRFNKIAGAPFRIVVCAYPHRTITPTVPLLKAALLYGDEVVLHSPLASMLGAVASLAHGDQQTFMRFAVEAGPAISADFNDTLAGLDATHGAGQGAKILEALFEPTSLARVILSKAAPEFRAQIAEFEREQLPGIRQDLVDVSERQIAEAGFGELDAAFEAGALSVRQVDVGTGDFETGYLAELDALLNDPTCYPVFDDQLGDIVRLATKHAQLNPAGYRARLAANADLSGRFVAKLPTFPHATVDEIVGIRDELRKPLVQFRSELLQVVAGMHALPWDDTYPHEVEAAWVGRVLPKLDELDEACQEKRLIKNYAPEAREALGALVSGGVMYAGVNALTPELFAQTAGVAGVLGITGLQAAKKHHDHLRAIARNPYFFLFDAERRLAEQAAA